MVRAGELGIEIAEMKNDLGGTGESLLEDKKFLAELEKGCDAKTAEWEERSKTRAEELLALADTIKVLNDDDLFVQIQLVILVLRHVVLRPPSTLWTRAGQQHLSEPAQQSPA